MEAAAVPAAAKAWMRDEMEHRGSPLTVARSHGHSPDMFRVYHRLIAEQYAALGGLTFVLSFCAFLITWYMLIFDVVWSNCLQQNHERGS